MIRLSNRQLLGELRSLRAREHNATFAILVRLAEVERRRLHLGMGYGSLFDFATRGLRYSESAAGRRIQAARCLAEHPEFAPLFRRNEITLSTLGLISRVVNASNKAALLDGVRNKSQREVEKLVASYGAPKRVRDHVRTVVVPGVDAKPQVADGDARDPDAANLGAGAHDSRSGSARHAQAVVSPTVEIQADEARAVETRVVLRFAAQPELMSKVEEARRLLSGRFPRGASLADIFDAALDTFLDRNSPARRMARRTARGRAREKRSAATTGTSTKRARVPAAIRDQVHVRDGGRCAFESPDGVRCNSSHDLEIDHIRPVARGGTNEADNLRLLCAKHNALEAERILGTVWLRGAVWRH